MTVCLHCRWHLLVQAAGCVGAGVGFTCAAQQADTHLIVGVLSCCEGVGVAAVV